MPTTRSSTSKKPAQKTSAASAPPMPPEEPNPSAGALPKTSRLDTLFQHLCSCSGLYAKETFLSLYGCVTRLLRDQRMEGLVLTSPGGDDAFATLSDVLAHVSGITLVRFDDTTPLPPEVGMAEGNGFLLVLTNKLCCFMYWSDHPEASFQMYEGGWTFHPADTKTIAQEVIPQLGQPHLETLLGETVTDRRYDEKLTLITTSLVQNLETRNRELRIALDRVNTLNKKMVETERMAAVGQLCSVIAHEIRNPLGLIDLYAKLVESQMGIIQQADDVSETFNTQSDTMLKNISLIRQATENLETILSELTQYSRPLTLNREMVDVIQLAQDVCDFYRPSYTERGMDLTFQTQLSDSSMSAILVSLDPGRIRQALINLLKNALEASPSGGKVVVTVASRSQDDWVYIKVTDQGNGVSSEAKKKLFTPYFSTKQQGTGLGLAHVRKTLQAHGGNAELLSSTPQEATTFALILPRQA